jgi:hypothetical protein
MPQYQGVWSLQQQMQALTSGQWATDPLFDYTTLLLQADNAANSAQNNTFLDSSTNAFAITRNGNTTQGTFSPFSATGWSNYFDGTTDKLYATVSAAGTGSFTYEAFVYPTAFASNKTIFRTDNSGALDISLLCNASGQLLVYNNGGTLLASTTTGLSLNTWAHVALVRNGTAIEVYINGVASRTGGSGSSSENLTFTQLDIGSRASDGIECWQGYISNARYCKAAVYTSGFTPATSSLTSSSQSATSCQLLTCQSNRFVDNSGNNYTLTTAGDTSVQAFSPFAPQFQYTATGTGGSGYFDGTTDYLSVANNTALELGSSDFTIECWVYPTGGSGAGRDVICKRSAGGSTFGGYSLYLDTSNNFGFVADDNTSTPWAVSITGTAVTLNQWTHIAVTRSGSTWTLWRNGVSAGTATSSITINTAATSVGIGAVANGDQPFTGYISGARIVKGTAVYTAAFTPPTAPPTAITNTSLLLNYTNAGILDGTMKNNLETVGGASVSTSVVKYGSGSLSFDGSGDSLTAPSVPLFNYGSANFTVELWIYLNAAPSNDAGIIDQRPTSTNGNYFMLGVNSSRQLFIYVNSVYRIGGSASTVLNLNTWTHVSYVRFGATGTLYINGSSVGTWADSTTYLQSPMTIGRHTQGGSDLNAYMDDLRITNGFARYTQNFIPPSVALPRQ